MRRAAESVIPKRLIPIVHRSRIIRYAGTTARHVVQKQNNGSAASPLRIIEGRPGDPPDAGPFSVLGFALRWLESRGFRHITVTIALQLPSEIFQNAQD